MKNRRMVAIGGVGVVLLLTGCSVSSTATATTSLSSEAPDPSGKAQLTLVPAVQQAAYSAMNDKGYVGAVVAIEPFSGNILAVVSTPSSDPNPLVSYPDGTQRQASQDLVNADPSPLHNRALSAVYPPGPTFELVIAAAALQNGYTPQTTVTGQSTITLPGSGGAILRNLGWRTCADAGGGDVTLTQALAFSCNTAFAEVAMSLGAPVVRKQADAFGINGEGVDIGLDVVGSRLGAVPDTASLAQTGIGQRDVATTPFEMAWVTATIANHGDRMAPHLIVQSTKPDLTVTSQAQPQSLGQAIPVPVADQLRDMMIESERNTPGSGSIADLVIASKTGTAEHGNDPNTPPHAWYVAFAPADAAKVAVAVLIEDGGDLSAAATGAKVASSVGRSVIAAALAGS